MKQIRISSAHGVILDTFLPTGDYTIGSADDASISIDNPDLAPHHARLSISARSTTLCDLGSAAGSFIDDVLLTHPTSLEEDQSARLGPITLSIRTVPPHELVTSGPRYLIGETVARGGMGAILQAQQNAMGREVAMKVMLRDDDPVAALRFINEARITGTLEHPNIPPVHELGVDEDKRVFYTMKFIRGTTLADILAKLADHDPDTLNRHPLASLLTIFQKVGDAIAFAHSRGVIHRDLKPENIMLGDFGEVLVMDWGLAKDTSSPDDESTAAPVDPLTAATASGTLEGSVMGTPASMSPEQARGEIHLLDTRSDIYALGTILHEILHLQPVVSGENLLEVVNKVATGERDPLPKSARPHLPGGKVPPSLKAVRRKTLAFLPDDRYQTVEDLQADINAYQTGFATSAEAASLATHLGLLIRRHKGIASSIAASLTLLAVLSLWFTINLVRERNKAETSRQQAVDALALVEPARLEATAQRDKATAALEETEIERQRATAERDRALAAITRAQEASKRIVAALSNLDNADEIVGTISTETIRTGDVDDALAKIEQAIESAPRNPAFRVARANLLQSTGRFSQAIPEYRRALAIRPDPKVAENLALTEKLEQQQGSEAQLRDTVREQLEAALLAQKRTLEATLLEISDDLAEPVPEIPAEEDEPADSDTRDPAITALLAKLTPYTSQPGWSDDRIKPWGDGLLSLNLNHLKITDLSMLRGTTVASIDLYNASIENLRPLEGLDLRHLSIYGTKVGDISSLRGMKLEDFSCETAVSDLSPLEGMPLKRLWLQATQATDLSPLKGMPLEYLVIDHIKMPSLDALVGLPLVQLSAESKHITDWSAISTLTSLKTIGLHRNACGIDGSKLVNLEWVRHRRFPNAPGTDLTNGKEFIRLSALSDQAWKNCKDTLAETDAEDLQPWRLTVRSPDGIDLDLRGTNITDLAPLAKLPVRQLMLDTRTAPLDLAPLANRPALRHLCLLGADIPALSPMFPGSQLESIALDPATPEIHHLARHPTLKFIGPKYDENLFRNNLPREQFFHPRVEAPHETFPEDLKPLLAHRFDEAAENTTGWTAVTDPDGDPDPLRWAPDPPPHNGRGGGMLVATESRGDGKDLYFRAPETFHGNKDSILNGLLEFQLRQAHRGNFFEAADVVLVSATRRLVHSFDQLPYPSWKTYLVPLRADGTWKVGDPEGRDATERDLVRVLSKLDDLLIRAEFTTHGSERTTLDDFRIWSPETTPAREALEQQRINDFEATVAWRNQTSIVTLPEPLSLITHLGWNYLWDGNTEDPRIWLRTLDDHQGVLVGHPLSPETPATLKYTINHPVQPGTGLKITAKGSFAEPGSRIVALHNGAVLGEDRIDNAWKTLTVPIPPTDEPSTTIEFQIWAVKWNWDIFFIDDIAISLPDAEDDWRTFDPFAEP